MLEILMLLIGFTAVLVAFLLIIVVIGIRQEPPTEELSEQPPTLLAAFVRRLLGMYVRKPDMPANLEENGKGNASLRTTPHIGPMDKTNL